MERDPMKQGAKIKKGKCTSRKMYYLGKLLNFFISTTLKDMIIGSSQLPKFFQLSLLVCLCAALYLEVISYVVVSKETSKLLHILQFNPGFFPLVLAYGVMVYFMTRPKRVFLVDYSCYRPPDNFRVPMAAYMEHAKLSGFFNEKSLKFQEIVSAKSGIGEQTALPKAFHYIPIRPGLVLARQEVEQVVFGVLDLLFAKTDVEPRNISILIVNCTIFNPMPTMASMIINKYKMRSNIKSYNLSGMGCSAGVIAIGAAKDLLQVHRNTYALVVSTENITQNWYGGNQRSMLIPNCLFRIGGAAILLSNMQKDKVRSKYEILHIVRTHKGADDRAYRCVFREEDQDGKNGVTLSKDLMTVAGDTLVANLTGLGPLVLPYSDQLKYVINLVTRKLRKSPKLKPYVPDLKLVFNHFCIHAGGKTVIDEMEKGLMLSSEHVEPSRMTLHRFGNTSSSTIWYELAYIEASGKMKKGDRVWQVAFGSGFKCSSAVWKALQTIKTLDHNPWKDCIHLYRFPSPVP